MHGAECLVGGWEGMGDGDGVGAGDGDDEGGRGGSGGGGIWDVWDGVVGQSVCKSVSQVGAALESCRWFYPVSYCASVCLMLGISSLSGLLLCVVFGPKILLRQRFSSMGYDEKVAKWFYCQTLHWGSMIRY